MTDIIDLETTYEQLRKSGPRMHQTLIAMPGERSGLVGRADEMALISGLIGRATAGSVGAVVLTGDAGVGKSALLAWGAELAEAEGVRVLRASGVEFEDLVSFSVLHQLLLPLMDELRALPGRPRTALPVALGFAGGAVPD